MTMQMQVDDLRRLWQRVVVQAIRDLVGTRTLKTRDIEMAQRQAGVWLTSGSEDFFTVCSLAGVDPYALRRWAEAHMENPNAHRSLSKLMKELMNGNGKF